MTEPTLADVCRRLDVDVTDLGPAAALPPQDAHRLAVLVEGAIERRDRQLREAVDASMRVIPRPLRRVVRKAVGG